jgi:hypothetical protein
VCLFCFIIKVCCVDWHVKNIVCIGWLDLLTPYTQHSELHIITALSLTYTIYSSLLQTLMSLVFTSRVLATHLGQSHCHCNTHKLFFSQPNYFLAIVFDCHLKRASVNSMTTTHSLSKSKSNLFYDWRFTTNQFVMASSPLRLTTGDFSFQLNLYGNSLVRCFKLSCL